ncbi:MAG: FG-GAP repeat protein [Planctomycetes bacterium]|nr:FG-GAP repeat protein [Planctomycetota bacterium]
MAVPRSWTFAFGAVLVGLASWTAAPAAFAGHDFNGDGFDDLAIGAPAEDHAGLDDCGAITILYGSANGLVADSTSQWFVLDDFPNVTTEAGAFFGSTLAAGDFDGDGFDDLAAAATGLTQGGLENAGAVIVLRGSAQGLLASSATLFSQATPGIPDKPEESSMFPGFSSERFGQTLASGDINGDGRADLAIGVDESFTNSSEQAGAVHVLLGSKKGLRGKGSRFIHLGTKGVPGQSFFFAHFASNLATGDVNGDGFDELCITSSVPYDVDTSLTVFVLRGSKKGVSTKKVAAFPPDANGFTLNDTSGSPLALELADVDADGFADVAMGCWFERVDGLVAAGVLRTLEGSALGVDLSTADSIDRGSPGVLGSPEQSAYFGLELAHGDFDGDGFADTVVAAPNATVGTAIVAGDLAVFPGSANGVSTQFDTYWSQDGLNMLEDAEDGDGFGSALACGDFDGDGVDDLAIGVPREDDGATDRAGMVQIVYGALGAGLDSATNVIFRQTTSGVPDTSEANDEFGSVLAK